MSDRGRLMREFEAHSQQVNCLAIGKKSGLVMATGGDDRKVNVWHVAKPNSIMSLTGHSSAVECVTFDLNEDVLVAGSAGGTLKLWDLDQQKVVRTFLGHKANCTVVDCHPYGEFIASGSQDTQIKLWDIRKKNCIQTYRGHNEFVNTLKFSPDGRWVVSGDCDGVVCIWDLTAGRQLHTFRENSSPISALDFHPNEFLLAIGSEDRSVKFYDVETFEMVSACDREATKVRAMCFHRDYSDFLFVGFQDSLKLVSWEPSEILDTVNLNWNNLVDVTVIKDQILGCALRENRVSVWMVPLSGLQLKSRSSSEFSRTGEALKLLSNSYRPPSSAKFALRNSRDPGDSEHATEGTGEDVSDPGSAATTEQTPAVLVPIAPIRAPVFPSSTAWSRSPPNPRNPETVGRPADAGTIHVHPAMLEKDDVAANTGLSHQPKQSEPSGSTQADYLRQPELHTNPTQPHSHHHHPRTSHAQRQPNPHQEQQHPEQQLEQRHQQALPGVSPTAVSGPREESQMHPNAPPPVFPAARDKPLELNMQQFALALPGSGGTAIGDGKGSVLGEEEVQGAISESHHLLMSILSKRLMNLKVVRSLWGTGAKESIEAMVKMNDVAVVVDILGVMLKKQDLFTLDMVVVLLPYINDILGCPYEEYITTALNTAMLFVANFGSLIRGTLSAPSSSMVDLSREERVTKCQSCMQSFSAMQRRLAGLARRGGKIGQQARTLTQQLHSLTSVDL